MTYFLKTGKKNCNTPQGISNRKERKRARVNNKEIERQKRVAEKAQKEAQAKAEKAKRAKAA